MMILKGRFEISSRVNVTWRPELGQMGHGGYRQKMRLDETSAMRPHVSISSQLKVFDKKTFD